MFTSVTRLPDWYYIIYTMGGIKCQSAHTKIINNHNVTLRHYKDYQYSQIHDWNILISFYLKFMIASYENKIYCKISQIYQKDSDSSELFYTIRKTEKINLALEISAHFYFFISIIDYDGLDIMLCFVHINIH